MSLRPRSNAPAVLARVGAVVPEQRYPLATRARATTENWYDLPGDTFVQKLIWLAGVGSLVYMGVRYVWPAIYTTGAHVRRARAQFKEAKHYKTPHQADVLEHASRTLREGHSP